jgi:hypothetical protein
MGDCMTTSYRMSWRNKHYGIVTVTYRTLEAATFAESSHDSRTNVSLERAQSCL